MGDWFVSILVGLSDLSAKSARDVITQRNESTSSHEVAKVARFRSSLRKASLFVVCTVGTHEKKDGFARRGEGAGGATKHTMGRFQRRFLDFMRLREKAQWFRAVTSVVHYVSLRLPFFH